MANVVSVPPKFIPAQNPIEFIYTSSNALPTPPTYNVWLVEINNNTDICGKKLTIGGVDYVFANNPANPNAPFIVPLNSASGWTLGCVPSAFFTYCNFASYIINALNNANQSAFYALPIGEAKTICGAGLAASICNELLAPYISFFIISTTPGQGLSLSTNSSNINLSLICNGATAYVQKDLRVATFVEVETAHRSDEFYKLPQFISSPELIQQPEQFGVARVDDFYIPPTALPFYFADIQSACEVYFGEDLPRLLAEFGGNNPRIKHCRQSIRTIKVRNAEVANTLYDSSNPNTIINTAYNPNGIYTILNARLDSYQNSLYGYLTNLLGNNPTNPNCEIQYVQPYPLEPYFEGTKLFLNTTQTKTIAVGDYEWIYFYNEFAAGLSLRMEYLATYNDGTTLQAISGLPFLNADVCDGAADNANSLIQIPVHHLWNFIPNLDTLVGLCVWINTTRITPPTIPASPASPITRVSTKYTYTISPICTNELLLFQNHLGQFETIAIDVPVEVAADFARDSFVQKQNASKAKRTQVLASSNVLTYQADLSATNLREQNVALMNSPSVYWIEQTTKTLEGCACPVSDCEQEARKLMDVLATASIEIYNILAIFPCTLQDFLNVFSGEWLTDNIQNSRCYDFSFQCGFGQGVEYTYIIATPKNPQDRTYITCMHDNGGIPKARNFESDLPNEPVPVLPVFPLSPTPATPPNYHVDYVDYVGRCGVPTTTEKLTPVQILNANMVLEEIKNELGIYRIVFRKEIQQNLGGIDNA